MSNILLSKQQQLSKRRYGGKHNDVLIRDNYTCQICGSRENIIVHHKKGLKSNNLKDLITLCRICHYLVHNNKENKKNIFILRACEIIELRNNGISFLKLEKSLI